MSIVEATTPNLIGGMVKPPSGPWCWDQLWRNVLFAHWRVPAAKLQGHLPAGLEIDTWEGDAWVSAVAFHLDARHRWLPSFGLASNFVELNLRTYVRWRDQRGIYFLSIHAGSRIAVALARTLTPLPYVHARTRYLREGTRWRLECRQKDESVLRAEFEIGPAARTERDSLDEWLVERYRLFATDRRGQLLRLKVEHPRWLTQRVAGQIEAVPLGVPWGIELVGLPERMHFSEGVAARLWPFERVDGLD